MLTGREVFEFGDVRVDLGRVQVTRDGQPVPLEPKTFEVLRHLIEHRDRLVTKEELLDTVWKDVFVTPNVLTRAVTQIRKAVGDDAYDAKYIETAAKRGYRFIAPVSVITSEASDEAPIRTTASPAARRWPWAAVAAIVLVALGVLAALAGRDAASTDSSPLRIERVTGTGDVIDAAISPDGRYVAYVRSAGGVQSLWIRQLQTGSAIELVPSAPVGYWGIAFAPDGGSIYYALKGPAPFADPGGTLLAVPALGGTPRRVLTGIDSSVTFSPDGGRLAYLRVDASGSGESAVMVANVDGTGERALTTRRPPQFFAPGFFVAPAWSPDGARIATPMMDRQEGDTKIVTIELGDASERVVQSGLGTAGYTAWLPDGSALLFAGRAPVVNSWGYGAQLWMQPYPDGAPRPITVGTAEYRNVTVSSDGRSLVSVGMDPVASLWLAPVDGRGDPVKLPSMRSDGVGGTAWNGDQLIYTGFDTGQAQLWTMPATGGSKRQLTTDGWNAWPAMSVDGRTIFFSSSRNGHTGIWRMDVDGRNQRVLAEGMQATNLEVTSDGAWLLFNAAHNGDRATWKIPVEGGTPSVVAQRLDRAVPSPDGKYVAGLWRESVQETFELAVLPIDGGAPVHRFPSNESTTYTNSGVGSVRWAPDGRGLYVTTAERTDVWLQPLDGGPLKRVTNFREGGIFGFSLSPDGHSLVVARGPNLRDAFLITGFH